MQQYESATTPCHPAPLRQPVSARRPVAITATSPRLVLAQCVRMPSLHAVPLSAPPRAPRPHSPSPRSFFGRSVERTLLKWVKGRPSKAAVDGWPGMRSPAEVVVVSGGGEASRPLRHRRSPPLAEATRDGRRRGGRRAPPRIAAGLRGPPACCRARRARHARAARDGPVAAAPPAACSARGAQGPRPRPRRSLVEAGEGRHGGVERGRDLLADPGPAPVTCRARVCGDFKVSLRGQLDLAKMRQEMA